jgi:hypothetical protein
MDRERQRLSEIFYGGLTGPSNGTFFCKMLQVMWALGTGMQIDLKEFNA